MLKIEEVPSPALRDGGIVVRNVVSLVSAGTERSIIELAEKSLVAKASSRPDLVRQVIDKVKSEGLMTTYRKVKSRLDSPIPLGYSCSGVVDRVPDDINEFAVGERVACAGFGYASHAESIFVPKNLTVRLPQSVTFEEGSFVTLGAIALQGIRQADVRLGETVAVFGLGLLGQLTVQMLKASGCRVVGLDIDRGKLELALKQGIDLAVDNSKDNFDRDVLHFTEGHGADAVIITAATQSSELVAQAAAVARDRARVTVVGAVGMDIPRKPFYEKELSLKLSRSYGPGRYDRSYEEMGNDYPIGYVRWTEKRNMQAFLNLVADKKVRLNDLITHRFKAEDAESAFDIVTGKNPQPHLGILLNYEESSRWTPSVEVYPRPVRNIPATDSMTIGAIGCGSFASGVIFPILQKNKRYDLKWLAAPNGVKCKSSAGQFGFQNATTDESSILADPSVGAVMILTPHNLHADQVVAALEAGKWVFVEKPLATTPEELSRIVEARKNNAAQLMVGFNRRYSEPVELIREKLAKLKLPKLFNYRINAGYIPKESPLQDDKIGKGRIVGEICHFIDLMAYLADAHPTEVFSRSLWIGGDQYLNSDNLHVSIRFEDGSAGTITYAACGGPGMPKEHLEVFCGGVGISLDDFKRVTCYEKGAMSKLYDSKQSKGHEEELEYFVQRFTEGSLLDSEFRSAVEVTKATFAVSDSMTSGLPVSLID